MEVKKSTPEASHLSGVNNCSELYFVNCDGKYTEISFENTI